MASYGSGVIAPSVPIFSESVTAQYVGAQINDEVPALIVHDESKIIVGDEEITGKQLSQVIKLMKHQFPEVFV